MPGYAAELRAKFHPTCPYEGFDYNAYPEDLQGGGGTPMMQSVFAQLKPKLVVEVGSWKGVSAIFWARLMKEHNIDGAVVCVDTWLGGIDHITRPRGEDWTIRKYFKNGYSTLYYQFLSNIMRLGLQDYIVPIPNSSICGARWMQYHGLAADLVYIDASHEEDDVYADMQAYWKVLKWGGAMLGDDFTLAWYPVICAVNRFAREKELAMQVSPPTWVIQKTMSGDHQAVANMVNVELGALKDLILSTRKGTAGKSGVPSA
jgi:hypothetical protein